MQSHSTVSASAAHPAFLGSPGHTRAVSLTTQHHTSTYNHGNCASPIQPTNTQRSYAGQFPGYVNTSPTSAYNTQAFDDRHSGGWSSPLSEHSVSSSQTYGHADSSYGVSSLQRQQAHGRYIDGTSFSSRRSPQDLGYSSSGMGSDRYRSSAGNAAPANYSNYPSYSSMSSSYNHGHTAAHPSQTTAAEDRRCLWGDRRCTVPLEDTTPSGIARHLRQHHDIAVTDNRTRGLCIWGGRCGKDMYPSSYGKHIAECHLRNMTKQCPHCGADFARADTLSRHIKAFCPNTGHTH